MKKAQKPERQQYTGRSPDRQAPGNDHQSPDFPESLPPDRDGGLPNYAGPDI